ncbi:MAG: hypothetical protein J5747_00975 [Spirochaetaceae bacterium]|nr:hypothetical protein [Spirochaetaceae bacterium]
MNVVKPLQMDEQGMLQLKGIYLAPYIQLATALIGKSRHAGGNMFRHQIDTMGILIDYGYLDGILLKASLIHDLIEDIPGYDVQNILNIDKDSPEVLKLVMEVTKKEGQTKKDFLMDIMKNGSENAKILKCADRISNMISLGFVTDEKFIARYCDETEFFVFPIALDVDYNMYQELINLVMTRRRYLEDTDYYSRYKE